MTVLFMFRISIPRVCINAESHDQSHSFGAIGDNGSLVYSSREESFGIEMESPLTAWKRISLILNNERYSHSHANDGYKKGFGWALYFGDVPSPA